MDAGGTPPTFAMTAFISFPQVLGTRSSATRRGRWARRRAGVEIGSASRSTVALLWPAGISPMCPPCQEGDFSLCWKLHRGRLSPGIPHRHAKKAPADSPSSSRAQTSMADPGSDDIDDDVAVLADPFAGACTRSRQPPAAPR